MVKRKPTEEDLFYEEETFNDIASDENGAVWEDVPLDGSINVTIEQRPTGPVGKRRKINKDTINYKKLVFGHHITLVPFFLNVLKVRGYDWYHHKGLNKSIKRTVPKLILKKFKKWGTFDECRKSRTLITYLLGLVLWFRDHFQINSNGFRQNFNRLRYLTQSNVDNKSKLYLKILQQPELYYGKRPTIEHDIDDVKRMVLKKMATRDILVIFFAIILNNVIKSSKNIRICFALPLPDYHILPRNINQQIRNGVGQVPNRFDTDLLKPNFWIELAIENELFVIDPITELEKGNIVQKKLETEYVSGYLPSNSYNIGTTQKFHYVVHIDCQTGKINDVSPRYLQNICYRYFDENNIPIRLRNTRDYKGYTWFKKCLRRINCYNAEDKLKEMALKNYILPKSLSECQLSLNFVTSSLLCFNETIASSAQCLGYLDEAQNHKIYWASDIMPLKSKQHWLMLGRSIMDGAIPIKQKHIKSRKLIKNKKYEAYEIRDLYSLEQTYRTPKIPNVYCNRYGDYVPIDNVNHYKNKYGHVEIYVEANKPDGFELVHFDNRMRKAIKIYNRMHSGTINYVEVVSGFDFKKTPGYAVPQINKILVHSKDIALIKKLVDQDKELEALRGWHNLISRCRIKSRLNAHYGET